MSTASLDVFLAPLIVKALPKYKIFENTYIHIHVYIYIHIHHTKPELNIRLYVCNAEIYFSDLYKLKNERERMRISKKKKQVMHECFYKKHDFFFLLLQLLK